MNTQKYKKNISILPVVIDVAHRAGKFVASRVGKLKQVQYKQGDITNVVTDVDRCSEQMIVAALGKKFPDFSVLGEEFGRMDNTSEYKWVIDPIDGTINFAHGLPIFAISIGLEYRGGIVLGVVYDPMRDETFHAIQHGGAFLNKRRIHVSNIAKLSHALIVTGFSSECKRNKKSLNDFLCFLSSVQAVRRLGSASLDICYVACGRFDGYWERRLSPWDTAAARCIIQEAGGMITKIDGKPYSHYDKEVLVSNGLIHRVMRKQFRRKMQNA